MEGWIKLHRKILTSQIFKNEKLLKVWVWCLAKATHQEYEQLVGKRLIHLERGQFIYGRRKASEELNMKESTVRDYMQLLKNLRNLDIKSDNKFSVVTIVNWDLYQIQERKSDIKSDSKTTTK